MLPRHKKVDELTVEEQLPVITQELKEVYDEYVKHGPINYQAVAMELADVMQAAWTGLLILQHTKGINALDIIGAMIVKNRERGYYVPNAIPAADAV